MWGDIGLYLQHGDILSWGKEVGGHSVITFGQNHHVYQDNYYNSVRLAETLLDRNVRVCGTMRANRGIPRNLEEDGKHSKKGQLAFQRKGDVMVQVWKDKRLVWMISTIHDATTVNTGRKDICKLCVVPLHKRVFFWEIPFSEALLAYLHAFSVVWSSGA